MSEILESVWAANEAYRYNNEKLSIGEEPDEQMHAQFEANYEMWQLVRIECEEILKSQSYDVNDPIVQLAIHASVIESIRGETLQTIVLRAKIIASQKIRH